MCKQTIIFILLLFLTNQTRLGKHVGTEVAQSGLGNDNQEKTYHSYYQWVPFVLFFQVCKFSLSSFS